MESYVERERQLKGCILNHAEQFRTKWTPNQTTTERLKYETFNQIHIHHKQRQREINSRWYNLYSVFFCELRSITEFDFRWTTRENKRLA